MGNETLTEDALASLPRVKVLGAERAVVEAYGAYTGMDGKRIEDGGMLAVACLLGPRSLFVKFVGPAPVVRAEKDNFLAFCRSLDVSE